MGSRDEEICQKSAKPRIGIVNFEKRKYPRFNVDLPVEYFRIDSSLPETARAINASEGGLLIYFPEKVKVGDRFLVRLFFSLEHELNTVEATVEVVWIDIHLDKDWGDYRSGVRFVNISGEDMNKLKSFLRDLAK